MTHLAVDHSYYDLEDPGLIREFVHKLKVGSKKAIDVLKKVNLKGLWLPDSKRIIVDLSVAEAKKKWVNAHELAHRIIPTHNQFFLADTMETLDPEYHEMLEAEANYGASALIFLGETFTTEALAYSPVFESVRSLSKKYQNSLATTLRRFVLYSHNKAMAGVISLPKWVDTPAGCVSRCRYFIPSHRFTSEFSSVSASVVMNVIDSYTNPKRGGYVGSGAFTLRNDNGETHIFEGESFYNQYDLLTLIVHKRRQGGRIVGLA
jgi:hypothetical protein